MSILIVFMSCLVVLTGLLLIALVLVQRSKGGGFGGSFGGLGESVFGAQAGSHLTKLTVIMTVLFLFLVLVLAVLIGRGFTGDGGSVAESLAAGQTSAETAPPAGN